MTEHRTGNSSGPGRVPPHNLEAEESALGAALLDIGAARALAETAAPADFYSPHHQMIAAAIVELAGADVPAVDVILVAEQLRKAGQLDEVGGIGTLAALQNSTPSISSAARYSAIVHDAAVLRRLIYTAAQIADVGYSADRDPSAAVVFAGELLSRMDVGDARSLSTMESADMAALIAGGLKPEEPVLLRRTDGAALLYSGKLHVFQAEPSSGKSWIALAVVAEVLDLGGAAVYLDFEDSPTGIATRLTNLSVPIDAIRDRFHYANLPGRFGPAEKLDLWRVLDELNPDLVVIDGVGEALSREGLSEDKADDVIRWTDLLPRPIAKTGAAVLMLDHVSKDPEQRGRWARGSGAKLAVVDGASYQLKVRTSFSRHRAGRVDVVIAKDRPGGVGAIGETCAAIHITPHAAGELVTVKVDPHSAEMAPTDSWKPTVLMGKVWHAINDSSQPLTAAAVKLLVHSDKPRLVAEAIARLTAEGYIAEAGKRPKHLKIVRPYDGAPPKAAPAWREEPPPAQLFEEDDHPVLSAEELSELDRQYGTRGQFFDDPEF